MTYKNKYYNTATPLYYGLSVLEYGWQQSGPLHRYGPSVRHHFVLHYIKEGNGKYVADGRRFFLKKNDIFIIYPESNTWYEAAAHDPWEYWWIGFTGLDAPQLVAGIGAVKEYPVCSINNGAPLLAIFENLQLPEDTVCNMNAVCFQIFDELLLQIKPQKQQQQLNYLLHRALTIVADRKALLTVEELSDLVGMSRSQLFRIFIEELKVSPQHYIISHKLHTALELLRKTPLTVSQIAEEAGFCDAGHFSRQMKKYLNITPNDYRKSLKKPVSYF